MVADAFSITYTSAKKTQDLKPFDDEEDLVLVERIAVMHDGKYYGALELETILNMVCWTKGEQQIANIRNRADNAIRELAFHTPEVWSKYAPLIQQKVGPIWRNPFTSQEEARANALDGWNAY